MNVVDMWKLSLHHALFSRFQMKHDAKALITISTFAEILTNIQKEINQEEISETSRSLLP